MTQTWTIETVLAHMLALRDADKDATAVAFASQKAAIDAALAAADRAVLKAEAATEKRFEGVNEFRSALADQQRTFMPRSEADSRMASAMERISKIEDVIRASQAERAGIRGGWGYAVGVAGFISLLAGAAFAAFK
jgi:hypothetical protein